MPRITGTLAIGRPLCRLGDVPVVAISVGVLESDQLPVHALYVFDYSNDANARVESMLDARYLAVSPENYSEELTVFSGERVRTGVYRSGAVYIATSKPDEWASGPLRSDVMFLREDLLSYATRDLGNCF